MILISSFKSLFVWFISVSCLAKPFVDQQGNVFQFVHSTKGKQQLNINAHIFSKISTHASVTYWRYTYLDQWLNSSTFRYETNRSTNIFARCNQYTTLGCAARCQISQNGMKVVSLEHNHGIVKRYQRWNIIINVDFNAPFLFYIFFTS